MLRFDISLRIREISEKIAVKSFTLIQ